MDNNNKANNGCKNYINNIISQLFDYGIIQFEKVENQEKLKLKILDPIIEYIGKKLYPYVLMTGFVIFLMIFILVFIIYILYVTKN